MAEVAEQQAKAAPATAGPVATPTRASAAPPVLPCSAAGLLQLQRAAGNRAAVAMLQRDAAPATDTPATAPSGFEEQKAALYAPDMQGLAGGVNMKDAKTDLAALAMRVQKMPALAKTDFLDFMKAYVEAAAAGDGVGALDNMYAAIACLDSVGAFTVGGKHYRKLDAPPDQEWLAEQRAVAMTNVHLWSKLNKYHSIDTVKGGDAGLTLESSAAGQMFDGLLFGMDYKVNQVMGQQWKMVSKTFVAQASGVVHAQVLQGIDESSVLFKTEWPEIKELIAQGTVTHLVVHFFDMVGGKLEEIGTPAIVVSQGDFNALPRVSVDTDAAYKDAQNKAYAAEEERWEGVGEITVPLGRYRKQFNAAKAVFEKLEQSGK